MTSAQSDAYTGTDNLEAMAEAVRYNSFVVNLVKQNAPKEGVILDFGAGTGTYTDMVADGTRKLVCVEPDADLRASLESRGYTAYASIDDVPRESCDFIYSLNVLEHIEDDSHAVKGLYNALKPGGACLIYVPAFDVLYSAMDQKVGHVRRYRVARLKSVLTNAGFTVSKARYADSIGFFATLFYKAFGNNDGSLNMKGLILYDRVVFPISRVADFIFHPFFGKNVFALARKPAGK